MEHFTRETETQLIIGKHPQVFVNWKLRVLPHVLISFYALSLTLCFMFMCFDCFTVVFVLTAYFSMQTNFIPVSLAVA